MTPRENQLWSRAPARRQLLEKQTRVPEMGLTLEKQARLKPLERERAEPLRVQAVMLASQPRLPM
jgi:hypothetical protein